MFDAHELRRRENSKEADMVWDAYVALYAAFVAKYHGISSPYRSERELAGAAKCFAERAVLNFAKTHPKLFKDAEPVE